MNYWLNSDSLVNIQHIGKLEEIDATFKMLQNRYKFSDDTFPHINKSNSYEKLSNKNRAILNSSTFQINFINYYRDDFNIFNYEYDLKFL